MASRKHFRLGRIASAAALACGAVLAGGPPTALAAPTSTAAGWRVVTTLSKHFPFLSALVAPSGTNIWAMGTGAPAPGASSFPIGRHWNGQRWSAVTFPKAINTTGIACAGASSATDVWAFAGTSVFGNSAAAAGALRLEHGRWVLVKTFPAGIVTNCLVVGPAEVWVFGDAHVAPGTGTWHLHGSTWTQIHTAGYGLDAASAVRPDDVWGLGTDDFFHAVVARWNGHAWVRNAQLSGALPKSGASGLGITGLADNDVWLALLTSGRGLLILHWNGTSWRHVAPSDPGYYLALATRGRGGWWADTFPALATGSLLHRVHDRWVKVPVSIAACPQPPSQLATIGGSSTVLGLQHCSSPQHENVVANGRLP